MRKLGLFALVLVILLATVGTAVAGGAPRVTTLSGAEEIGGGDPDGSGFAAITLNVGQGSVCWKISVSNLDPVTAAHIHAAPAGVNGPVVVPLNPFTSGCTGADPGLIQAIIDHPEQYYVNVHTTVFPGGAIRGQLSNRGQSE
jgi:CHRD domain